MGLHSRSAKRTAGLDNDVTTPVLPAEDVYDERQRQTKALAHYERQKAAWDRMQAHLLSATSHSSSQLNKKSDTYGNRHAPTAQNMAHATAIARAKREDDIIIHVATAGLQNGGGSHAWESLLRCTSEQEARRLVPIGRTCVPYPLYSETRDPGALPDDHLSYARVVSEEDVSVLPNTVQSNGLRFSQSAAQPGITRSVSDKYTRERTVAQERVRAALTSEVGATSHNSSQTNNKRKTVVRDLFVEDAASSPSTNTAAAYEDVMENGLSPTSYYEEQLQRFAPYVQQRLGHLLQPRAFLHVEGHPAPCATAADTSYLRQAASATTADGERPGSAPPVEYFPPPPPPPQMQLWTSSTLTSQLPSRHGRISGRVASVHTLASSEYRCNDAAEDNGDDGEEGNNGRELPRDSVSTAEPHRTDVGNVESGTLNNHYNEDDADANKQRSQPPSPLHPMRVLEWTPSTCTELKNNSTTKIASRDGPAMELSTRALFFHTCPHELLQGNAALRNVGSTTVYFSWTVVDVMQEHLRERYEAEHGTTDDSGGVPVVAGCGAATGGGGERIDWVKDNATGDFHQQQKQRAKQDSNLSTSAAALPYESLRLTHLLAAHQRTARESFFFMSAPLNGVVLPGEETVFPFSVRATREGLFQQTYELLTVPPAPARIFFRLRALVQRAGPALQWLARPVAESLNAKVMLDAQRRLVQEISADTTAIEAAELRARLAALDGAAEVAKANEWARRRAQEKAWYIANRRTFDNIPFHAAVYDKLERLSAVVRETYLALSDTEDAAGDNEGLEKAAAAQRKDRRQLVSGVAEGNAIATPQKQRLEPSSVVATPASSAAAVLLPSPHNPHTLSQQQAPSTETISPAKIQWDGALLPLLYQIMSIRDNATRQVFLDAMQVLLRAARASRDVIDAALSNTHNNSVNSNSACRASEHSENTIASVHEAGKNRAEDEEENGNSIDNNDVPLAVLLTRAAAALADVIVSRQRAMVEKQCEDLLLQPIRPAAALSLCPVPLSENSVPAGPGKGHTTTSSPSNQNNSSNKTLKKTAAAVVKENKSAGIVANGGASPVVASSTPAQRLLLNSIPTAALQGFSVSLAGAETMTLLRAAEERVLRARVDSELAEAKAAFTALHSKLFREVVDAACDRTPLATCTKARLAEMRAVQQSAPLVVDVSVDPLVVPPAGKSGKRK